MTRHFLDLAATSAADLRAMLDAARAMKAARAGLPKGTADADRPLAGRVLAMIFEKPSTRTRVSFDMAMRQLGGETILLNGHDMQLGRGETLADTARVLSRYVDAIMIRTTAHEKLLELAAHADVPVLNALTDDSHPCQVMADVMTIEEHRGAIAGKKVAWTGDGNNMAQTLIEAAGRFGFALALATPQALDVAPRYLDWARREGADVTVTRDPAEAVAGADAVITDTWLSMGDQGAARERRHNLLRPYQVDAALMARARPDALFLHCLPAHRGEEATAAVLDGPQSVIFDEAENRLHAQKGILRWCLEAV
ncbi:MAG: ornithine carbamoyltransferase [Rhodobacterales bacterium CG_4_9_14_3_um_filter_71_31]|nr:MAG: ornithine carbamoyltransferase [Rhodobacterales bacterium CG_4_9_14_3_um_filter_71_31]